MRYTAVIDSYLVLTELLVTEEHRHIDLKYAYTTAHKT
jgi:hypothetical protein